MSINKFPLTRHNAEGIISSLTSDALKKSVGRAGIDSKLITRPLSDEMTSELGKLCVQKPINNYEGQGIEARICAAASYYGNMVKDDDVVVFSISEGCSEYGSDTFYNIEFRSISPEVLYNN